MEKKKQLNFSAPLLSARRYSSPRATDGVDRKMTEKSPPGRWHSLPVPRSEWESEEVTKPAAVPFLWERTPGRPKAECIQESGEEPSVIPRLPPGRLHDASQRSGEVYSPRVPPGRLTDLKHRSGEFPSPRLSIGRLSDVRPRSGEVSSPRFPRGMLTGVRHRSDEVSSWKFRPGKISDLRHRSSELPKEQKINNSQAEVLAVSNHATLLESLKDSLYTEGESDKESEEDAYSDALDALSPPESLSLTCSISGLSGSQGWNCKPSGTFSIDPQTKDFMMSRFLPAAKAVVLEIPQYASKKQNVLTEEPILVKKVIHQERNPLTKPLVSGVLPFHPQYTEDVESEDGEDDRDDLGKIIGKSCGLFPRLCVKNSLSLLNPVKGTKLRTRPSTPRTRPLTPSVYEVKKLMRKAYSGPLDQHVYNEVYKKRYHSGVLSQELHKAGNRLLNDPTRNSFSSDSYTAEGLSPFRRPRSGAISPYRNERPPSPFREGARFLGLPKEVEDKAKDNRSLTKSDNKFQNMSSKSSYKPKSESFGHAVEKTLYIDSVNYKIIPKINVDFSKSEKPLNSTSEKLKIMTESRGVREYLAAISCSQDIEGVNVLKGESEVDSKSSSPGTAFPSSTWTSEFTGSTDKKENLNLNQNLDKELSPFGSADLPCDGKLDTKDENIEKPDGPRDFNPAVLPSPLPPPLPESPSESWLWRTLPSISLRNPFSHSHSSHIQSKKQNHKQSNTVTKWETIVKSSNIHYDHIRYSEELISRIPRQLSRK